jgi:hypothetical protein
MMTACDEEKDGEGHVEISLRDKKVPVSSKATRSYSYEGTLLSGYSFGGLDQLCRLEEQVEVLHSDLEAIKKRNDEIYSS